ncbi:MFS transporter [Parasalinivibrio latis]|uniref:MFS transporter n=1 Tax=Parasalinivibrio latis TaxID=2952610 RepID=UPI0030E4DB48
MNRNVWLLALCQALLMTGNIVLISVNGLIGQALSPSPEWVTLPVATQFVGLMLATLPASFIMAKIGRRRGFVLGNLIGICGAGLCFFALSLAHFWLFTFGTLLLGVGIGFGTLYRFAAVEVADEKARSRAISISMAGGVLAAVLGPNLAIQSQNWLPGVEFQGAFLGVMGLYIVSLGVLRVIELPPAASQKDVEPMNPASVIAQRPGYLLAVLAGTVAYMVMNLLMTVTPMAMMRCGFDFTQAAVVIEWHVLGMFVPAFFTGHLIDKIGARNTILLGGTILVACILVNFNGITIWHFRVALLLLGVGWNFMFIAATQLLTRTYEMKDKAKAQAMNEFVVFGSVTVTSLMSGWLEVTIGWQMLNLVMLPIVALTMVVFFASSRTLKQVTAS